MAGLLHQGRKIGAGPDHRLDATGAQGGGFLGAAGGADHAPALRQQELRQSLRRIAMSKGKKGLGHAAHIGRGKGAPQGHVMCL